jgi:hypothetical protein
MTDTVKELSTELYKFSGGKGGMPQSALLQILKYLRVFPEQAAR